MIRLVLIWHQHQPYYRDLRTGVYRMPWVRLHGTKDYYGMARLLLDAGVRVTVNLVPSLLDQLLDYAGGEAKDTHLSLSAKPAEELSEEERAAALDVFFRANWERMIAPYPRYRELFRKRRWGRLDAENVASDFTDAELRDLQVWGNLAWFHRLLLRENEMLRALVAKDRAYTEEEKASLLAEQQRVLAEVVPMYRELADRGTVEISTSPYYHPILPLLVDMESARVALPGTPLPAGRCPLVDDARRQLALARERHEEIFGRRPAGLWPSEGSVSPGILPLVAGEGFRWLASDQDILAASVGPSFTAADLYRAHRVEAGGADLAMLFRDHRLSDLVSFDYQRMRGEDAAADFVARIRDIGTRHADALVTVILDGENPWEFYPDGGVPFLRTLYRLLAEARDIETVLPGEELERNPPRGVLSNLHSGSWIHANFAIWIGHEEDVRAWEYLYRVREDLVAAGGETLRTGEEGRRAWESLFVAEGSDWTWWYGDDHTSGQDEEFDELFRTHLANVYRFIGRPVPAFLDEPVSLSRRELLTEPPVAFLQVRLDGRVSSYFEWLAAGRYRALGDEGAASAGGAMHRAEAGRMREIRFGFDAETFYLRVDFADGWREGLVEPLDLVIVIHGPEPAELVVVDVAGAHPVVRPAGEVVVDEILELGVPFESLGLEPGDRVILHVELRRGGSMLERLPGAETIRFAVPTIDFEVARWHV